MYFIYLLRWSLSYNAALLERKLINFLASELESKDDHHWQLKIRDSNALYCSFKAICKYFVHSLHVANFANYCIFSVACKRTVKEQSIEVNVPLIVTRKSHNVD